MLVKGCVDEGEGLACCYSQVSEWLLGVTRHISTFHTYYRLPTLALVELKRIRARNREEIFYLKKGGRSLYCTGSDTMEDGAVPAFVRVQEHATRGKVLVATRHLHAGQTISIEQPLITVLGRVAAGDVESAFRAYLAFTSTSSAAQALILGLFSPVDGHRAALLRAKASAHPQMQLLSEAQLELLVKVAMAFTFNGAIVTSRAAAAAVAMPGAPTTAAAAAATAHTGGLLGVGGSSSSALFETACRCSHSCQPNCCWYSDVGGSRVIRTLAAIPQVWEMWGTREGEGHDSRRIRNLQAITHPSSHQQHASVSRFRARLTVFKPKPATLRSAGR